MFGERTSRILSLVRMKPTSPSIGASAFTSAENSDTGVVAGRMSDGLALICNTGALDFATLSMPRRKRRFSDRHHRPAGTTVPYWHCLNEHVRPIGSDAAAGGYRDAVRPDDGISAMRRGLSAADQRDQRAGGVLRHEDREPARRSARAEDRHRTQARDVRALKHVPPEPNRGAGKRRTRVR